MTILIILICAFVGYFVFYASRRKAIGTAVWEFTEIYEDILVKSGSKLRALQESLISFKSCPGLNVVTESEWQKIAEILDKAADPKMVIYAIVRLPLGKIVPTLRNASYLTKMVCLSKIEEITADHRKSARFMTQMYGHKGH